MHAMRHLIILTRSLGSPEASLALFQLHATNSAVVITGVINKLVDMSLRRWQTCMITSLLLYFILLLLIVMVMNWIRVCMMWCLIWGSGVFMGLNSLYLVELQVHLVCRLALNLLSFIHQDSLAIPINQRVVWSLRQVLRPICINQVLIVTNTRHLERIEHFSVNNLVCISNFVLLPLEYDIYRILSLLRLTVLLKWYRQLLIDYLIHLSHLCTGSLDIERQGVLHFASFCLSNHFTVACLVI